MCAEEARLIQVFDQTLAWSRARDYREHTKHDALNSPLVWAVAGHHRWTRILATQAVMRFPVNVRSLLGVPQVHNPKGLALFVMALLDRYESTQQASYLEEARRLLELLHDLRSDGDWGGDCWGYQYPWQDLGFFAPRATPNAVVTAFVCEALLAAYRLTGDENYLHSVESAAGFFLGRLPRLLEEADRLCLGYMPMDMSMRVMDVSILVGAVLAQLAALSGDTESKRQALRLTGYVVSCQTAEGAWFYTDPPEDSPVKIDNYHTGFILDALERVMNALGHEEWREDHRRGLEFYAQHLFNADGSPRWMSHQDFPHDIHGAAQGILSFSSPTGRRVAPELAGKIMDWTLRTLYDESGRFYYQEGRRYRKKFTFMRWCNAWMCKAMAAYLSNPPECRN